MVPRVLLWLFVLNLGVVFGAGIYEARISVARWIGPSQASGPGWHAQEALRDDTGRRFWAFTTTIPLTLLTLANLWAAWQSSGPIRMWWLAAALSALADRIFTFVYFIPRMVGMLRVADSPEARASMMQWANLNYIRLLLVLVAWLAALQTFALLHAQSTQGDGLSDLPCCPPSPFPSECSDAEPSAGLGHFSDTGTVVSPVDGSVNGTMDSIAVSQS